MSQEIWGLKAMGIGIEFKRCAMILATLLIRFCFASVVGATNTQWRSRSPIIERVSIVTLYHYTEVTKMPLCSTLHFRTARGRETSCVSRRFPKRTLRMLQNAKTISFRTSLHNLQILFFMAGFVMKKRRCRFFSPVILAKAHLCITNLIVRRAPV